MAEFMGETFEGRTELVDGNTYDGCRFRDCTLIHEGGEVPHIIDCTFEHTRLKLQGAAERTAEYMRRIHRSLVGEGPRVVQGWLGIAEGEG
jgi:hypothetical protein